MGPYGAVIMSFFGGVYFVAASVLATGWKTPLLAIPLIIFAVIAAVARNKVNSAPSGYLAPSAKARKVIAGATIFEGIGIAIVISFLLNTGQVNLVSPGVAFVVGLHFLPMAYGIPFRPFYIPALLMILAALAGVVLAQPVGSITAGFVASLVLWGESFFALRRKPA